MAQTEDSPAHTFTLVAEAVRKGDWPVVVRQLRKQDVLRLLENSVSLSWSRFANTPELAAIHARYRFTMPSMEDMRTYRERSKEAIKAVKDPVGLLGELESKLRANGGGGSLSSSLFVDEELKDVVVEGSKARGVRVFQDGQTQPLAFVKERGGWRIALFARG